MTYFTKILSGCLLALSFAWAQLLPATYAPIAANPALELELLKETNTARNSHGLGPLMQDETLALAARHHAQEMAQLNYFAHSSPTTQNRTLAQRVARAGSPLINIGENLAKFRGEPNLAKASVEGWLNSPSHRENLLQPMFTHVGFGSAQDTQGHSYIVQVFAYQPFTLRRAEAALTQKNVYALSIDFVLKQASEVAFAYGEAQSEIITLPAGQHRHEALSAETGQIHVRSAVLASEGGGLIGQTSGWHNLTTGRWEADPVTHAYDLEILGVSSVPKSEGFYDVALSFDGSLGQNLAVLVDESYQPEAILSPGELRISVPASASDAEMLVAVVEEGSSLNVVMGFRLDFSYGSPRILPWKPRQY